MTKRKPPNGVFGFMEIGERGENDVKLVEKMNEKLWETYGENYDGNIWETYGEQDGKLMGKLLWKLMGETHGGNLRGNLLGKFLEHMVNIWEVMVNTLWERMEKYTDMIVGLSLSNL